MIFLYFYNLIINNFIVKNLIFAIGLITTSFGASAQCNAQSTQINTSCGGSYSYTVEIQRTGFLEVDIVLWIVPIILCLENLI
jgi:hypothetical protein